MTGQGWLQILIYVAVLTALTPVLGGYMARVYMGRRVVLERALGPVERLFYRAGGVDSGLYAILVYALLAVFAGGLMVGRTPEYLGKKIYGAQMTLVVLFLLVLPAAILGFSAAAALLPGPLASRLNPGMHGLAEIVYAYASAANGNGSAFAGLAANTTWYNTTLGLAMLAGATSPSSRSLPWPAHWSAPASTPLHRHPANRTPGLRVPAPRCHPAARRPQLPARAGAGTHRRKLHDLTAAPALDAGGTRQRAGQPRGRPADGRSRRGGR